MIQCNSTVIMHQYIFIYLYRGSLEPGLVAILMASSQTLVSVAITECNLMITERQGSG